MISLSTFILWAVYGVCSQANPDSRCPRLSRTHAMLTYRNKCLQISHDSVEWKSARNYCRQKGGRVVSANNPDIVGYLHNALNSMSWNTESFWIGLNKLKTQNWHWIDYNGELGPSLSWSNWAPSYPHQPWYSSWNCAYMAKDGGVWQWKNHHCNSRRLKHHFICEYQATSLATTTGIKNSIGDIASSTAIPGLTSKKAIVLVSGVTEKSPESLESTVRTQSSSSVTEVTPSPPIQGQTTEKDGALDSKISKRSGQETATRGAEEKGTYSTKPGQSETRREFTKTPHEENNTKNDIHTQSHIFSTDTDSTLVIILALVAGLCMGGLVGMIIFVYRRGRRGRSKAKRVHSIDDMYLNTVCSNTSLATENFSGVIPNDYATKNPEDPKIGDLCRRNPTLAGSMMRGRLPELPIDEGYEIPVKLITEDNGASSTNGIEGGDQYSVSPAHKEQYQEIPADLKYETAENDYHVINFKSN